MLTKEVSEGTLYRGVDRGGGSNRGWCIPGALTVRQEAVTRPGAGMAEQGLQGAEYY